MKRFLGLVLVPAFALIVIDPAAGKTVKPEGFGLVETKDKHSGRQGSGSEQRRIGIAGNVLPDGQNVPRVPPVKGKQPKLGYGFAFAGGAADNLPKRSILGDLLAGGSHHRKAVWPGLDFTGYGSKGRGPVRPGGAGGWGDGPGGPIDPVTPPGGGPDQPGGPEEHTGGPTDGGNPFIPDEPVDHGDQGDGISPVPLPAAGWLMVAALGGLAAVGRRRNRA
ncbi:VPLPA-CTERM sorting domain-containing protein [Fuscibacter oryzae]|uniref:VPLPA-CTERM sorting domain-containing protein n=1 Tax=Fuscibacter oryzae TaxID=2803939 RepID=A0A8J7SRZ8_9RHOB|nr:VPLPA-CTERM sorting domain-containing protein [Fuscibacter oryzae]MBL4927966.1 VPLPA-CTERM sorting domain-containing protein [Fuscibacter oryzae]